MLHWLVSSSLQGRNLVAAAIVVVLGLGFIELRQKPLDMIPEFSPLSLTVKTESLGLSSAEVESLITVPLEADLLNGVPWLQVIQSESMPGLSTIEMIFAPGTDLMQARQMVQERLTQAHALPNVSLPPVMLQPVSSASRILNIGLSSKTVSLIDMSVTARWSIMPRLVGVAGVANVSIWGKRDRQMQVLIDPRNLRDKKITLEQVVKTAGEAVWSSPLTYLNSSTPGTSGFIDTPNQRLNIRHQSPINSPEGFARIPVVGTTQPLGSVAQVIEGHQALIGDAVLKDGVGLMLVIEKFPGSNTQDVIRNVERALADMKPGLGGIDIDTTIYRPAGYIERATANLSWSAGAAAVLMVVGLGVLMSSWQAALVAAITIPLSLVAAALALSVGGVQFNMLVVAGLLIALGAVIHDSIIDVEAAQARLRADRSGQSHGVTLERSLLKARGPLVFATLIIVLGVVPALFMESRSAAFFQPLVLSYIAAVIAALLVALLATPAVASLVMGGVKPGPAHRSFVLGPLAELFGRLGNTTLHAPMAGLGIAVVALVIAGLSWTRLERDMLPRFKETDVLVEFQGPAGMSLQAMTTATSTLIKDLRQIPGVRNAAAQIGRALLCTCDDAADVNSAEVWVSIDPAAPYDKTIDALEELAASYPGMRGRVETYLSKKMREALTGNDDALTVRVYGHNLDILSAKAEEIRVMLSKIRGIENPRVEQQTLEPSIEVQVDIDKAAKHGLKPGDIRRATSAIVGGITVGSLFHEQKIFDVVVWGRPELRESISDVRNLLIDTDTGTVRLEEVADVRIASANSIIYRQGSSRRVSISADVGDRPLGDIAADVASALKAITFPFEYHAEVVGEHAERRAALRPIYAYMMAGTILIFLLLQSSLGSWTLAALSVGGVPIALVGGLIATLLAGGVFSLGSLLGFVTVLGLAVRHGISFVAHCQSLERDQVLPFGADLVRRAVQDTFVPIVASTLVTALAMVPFVLLGDVAGMEIVRPIAVVVLGGLLTSVIGTLLVIPGLYLRFGRGSATDRLNLDAPAVA